MTDQASRPEPAWHLPFYRVCQFLLSLLFGSMYRARTFGAERVPMNGPVLIVANHQSFFDPPAIGYNVPRRFTFLARASLFDIPPLGWLISTLNSLPIRQGEGDTRAIRQIIDRLKKGEAVLLFPEGSRTYDGELQPMQSGAALIARKARCPVLPCAIDGAFEAWPRKSPLPKPFGRQILVNYGEVIQPDELRAGDPTQLISDRIAQLIEQLKSYRADPDRRPPA